MCFNFNCELCGKNINKIVSVVRLKNYLIGIFIIIKQQFYFFYIHLQSM